MDDNSHLRALGMSPVQFAGRKTQDLWAGITFILLTAATVTITIIKGVASKEYFNEAATSCLDEEGNLKSIAFRFGEGVADDPISTTNSTNIIPDLIHAVPYLGASVAFAVILGVVWMVALRKCAKPIIYATLFMIGSIFIGLAVFVFVVIGSIPSRRVVSSSSSS